MGSERIVGVMMPQLNSNDIFIKWNSDFNIIESYIATYLHIKLLYTMVLFCLP